MRKSTRAALVATLCAAALFAAMAYADPSVRLVAAGPGKGDPLADDAWKAILAFYGDSQDSQAKRGGAYDLVAAADPGSFGQAFEQAAEAKADLVAAAGPQYAQALAEAAAKHPDQKFLIIGGAVDCPNVASAGFSPGEGAYLAGLAAGLKAKAAKVPSPRFAFMGAEPSPEATALELGYAQGVLAALPGAALVDFYAKDRTLPELGKVQARSWYDAGVYCIFAAAGATGEGAAAAARERRAAGGEAWIVRAGPGRDEPGAYDPASSRSAVLGTVESRAGAVLAYTLGALRDGTFKTGPAAFGLASGAVEFSTGAVDLGKDIAARLEAARKDIASGKIKLYASYAGALAAKALPPGLQAQDD